MFDALLLSFNPDLRQILIKIDDIELTCNVFYTLSEIKAITDYSNGFIILDTNYGVEYIDLNELMELYNEDFAKLLKSKLSGITKAVLETKVYTEIPATIDADIIKDGLIFKMLSQTDTKVKRLVVHDLYNPVSGAVFIINSNNQFELITSSFTEVRKFEAMYLAERYKEILVNNMRGCKPNDTRPN